MTLDECALFIRAAVGDDTTSHDPIPLVDLRAGFEPIADRVFASWRKALEGMRLHLGPNVEAFEASFKRYCGARHGVGVGSGTDALVLALIACGVGRGDEVITTAHTFFATVEAIVHVGARPVFVDIDPRTHLMDVSAVAAAVTPRTRAALPVHVFGQCADIDAIRAALPAGVAVIEDAAEAHGARRGQRRAGVLGDAAAFSFYFTKNLGGYGEGGFVTTDDEEIARKVALLRNHGQPERFKHTAYGFNARLDELQAAVLDIKLTTLDADNRARIAVARRYDEALAEVVEIPVIAAGGDHVYYAYVIQTDRRDALRAHLAEAGIGTATYWPVPIHLQPVATDLGYAAGSLPFTERVAKRVLALPMYPQLTDMQVARVAKSVRSFFG